MRWLHILFVISCLTARVASAEETFVYTIQAGDSCGKIAKKFFGATARYDLIHKYNPNMGPTPHKLKPGDTLILPTAKSDADAVLTQKRGDVEARSPSDADWREAKRGLELFKAWKVGSKDDASAEITFRDDSAVFMRENTIVIIYGDTSSASKKTESSISEAKLEQGSLRGYLDTLSGKKVVVTTTSSTTSLSGGSTVISVDETGATRVANHEGKSAKVSSNDVKGASVDVKPGMGSKVEPKKAPSKPKPLPPSPSWISTDNTLLSYTDTATITGEWQPVPLATSYRLELLQGKSILQSATSPANVSSFELKNIPAGTYQVRISAIDSDKFESVPSKKLSITVVSLALSPKSEDIVEQKILVGSYFVAPDGFLCALPGQKPTNKIEATAVGEMMISCKNKSLTLPEIRLRAYEKKPIQAGKIGLFFIPDQYRL